jgi:predicted aspartyl protease
MKNTLHSAKKIYIYILLACVTCGCMQTPKVLFDRMLPQPEQSAVIEIPLKFEERLPYEEGLPYVTIKTAAGRSDLLFDTGAKNTTIDLTPELIEKLNVRHVGGPNLTISNYGFSIYRHFVLPEVNIGKLSYKNLLCGKEKLYFHGVMGLALFKEFNLLINYKEEKILLYRNNKYPNDIADWQKIPFFATKHYGTIVKGRFQGSDRELTFLVDTGACGIGNNGEVCNFIKGSAFDKLAGNPGEEIRSHNLILGQKVIQSLNFMSSDWRFTPSIDGVLGSDFFLKHTVFLDFENLHMYIRRNRK